MKSTQPLHKATVRICNDSAEQIDEACITEERAIDAGTSDIAYWRNRVTNAFAKAGLTVHRLHREEHHPVWVIRLDVGAVILPADRKAASKYLRKALAEAGLRVPSGQLDVVERRGGRLKCVFVFGAALPAIDLIGI